MAFSSDHLICYNRFMTIKRPNKFKYGVLGAAFFNAVVCMFGAFFLLGIAVRNDVDIALMEQGAWFKTLILGMDKKPPKKDYLFIDVSRDKQLVDILDKEGFPVGNQAITDREKLAELFGILGEKPKNQPLILCDILFDSQSPADSALQVAMAKLPNLVLSYSFSEDGKGLRVPVFKKVKRGIANYETYNNTFMKFRLIHKDTLPSVPLQMYAITEKKTYQHGKLFTYLNNRPIMSYIGTNLRIRNYDLFDAPEKKRYNWIRLGELLMFPEDVPKICQDRILVIGSFNNDDKHETIMGDIYGPLILVNTYLALKHGDNIITWGWLLFMFGSFYVISVFLFWQAETKKLKFIQWFNRGLFRHILRFVTYAFGIVCIMLVSFLFFNKHLNIMNLGIWFYLLDSTIKYIYRRKGWLPPIAKNEV